MRLTKLANWLSEGDLEQYQQKAQQAQQAQAKLEKMESEQEKLQADLQQTQKELIQTQAQLQINQGFQIELGETQLKLQKAETEAEHYKKELFEQQKQFNLANSQFKQAQQALAKTQNWLEQIQSPIQVTDIQKTLPKHNFETLWGFGIMTPEVESITTTGAILVKGWVLGKKSHAQILRVNYQTEVLLETPVQHARPIVMQRYPDIPTAKNSGFEFSIAVVGITTETKFSLEAVLEDQNTISLCDIIVQPQQNELNAHFLS